MSAALNRWRQRRTLRQMQNVLHRAGYERERSSEWQEMWTNGPNIVVLTVIRAGSYEIEAEVSRAVTRGGMPFAREPVLVYDDVAQLGKEIA